MKRFVGLFISVALLLQMLLVPSFSGDAADSGVNFTLSAARSGDTLEVSVTVSGDASYNSMALYNLNYDKAYLTFTGFSGNEDILRNIISTHPCPNLREWVRAFCIQFACRCHLALYWPYA